MPISIIIKLFEAAFFEVPFNLSFYVPFIKIIFFNYFIYAQ